MSTVQTLDVRDLDSASELLAMSFYDNPAHIYICPNDEKRLSTLRWLLGSNLKLQKDLSKSFCLSEQGKVQAMGFWTRLPHAAPTLVAQVMAGLLLAPVRLGFSGLSRLTAVTSGIDNHLKLAFGDRQHWYLNNMAISPSLRGKGLGGKLLHESLAKLKSNLPLFPAALATQRPENVSFYMRVGFRVAWEEEIGTGAGKFTNWIMERDVAT